MNRDNRGNRRNQRRANQSGRKNYRVGYDKRGLQSPHDDDTPGPSSIPQHNEPQMHPPHLRGKDIGLFYARKQRESKENRKAKELKSSLLYQLTEAQVVKIRSELLSAQAEQEKDHYSCSTFKKKFLENLKANDDSHFATSAEILQKTSALIQDPVQDQHLQEKLSSKDGSQVFKTMMEARRKLPTWSRREEILKAVQDNQVVVICGETGCGKTTQVGQFLLDEAISSGRGSAFRAICTQPRRIAAISVAQRVAQERCEPCGGETSSVGYQIRLERKLPRERGSILFCTTGILVQFLQSDPYLENVSHLLLDEVHERDVLTDFLLTVVRDLLPKRPQLRVILMSATINSDVFSRYFNDCPVLVVPGMTHPVETFYLEDILTKTDFRVRPKYPKRLRGRIDSQSMKLDVEYTQLMIPSIEEMETNRSFPYHVLKSLRMRESEESPEELLVELIKHICAKESGGAILIFFPGWEQISRLHKELLADRYFSSRKYLILPLHSMMPTVNQRQIFDRPPPGVRKIILSTNIAETSLTIDDVVYVIDCGKVKQSDYDPKKNLDTLQSEWISLANGRQRQGRAGRTQPGICYRLYSRCRESSFAPHPVPEMRRMRLEELILRVKILKLGQVEVFLRHVPEPPEERTVQHSLELLRTLGALDESERLTPLGFHLAQLPTDPRTGKLILLGAMFGCLEPVLSVAASLSFKDPFVTPLNHEELVRKCKKQLDDGHRSDHLLIARVMRQYREIRQKDVGASKNFCYQHYLSSGTMSMLCDMVDQFCRDLHERQFLSSPSVTDPVANVHSKDHRLVRAVLCAGLFPNIAKVHHKKGGRPSSKGNSRHVATPKIITSEDGRVNIHPRSVNYDVQEFESSWICYHGKVKTTSIFLHDCSEVSPMALMFFGGRTGAADGQVNVGPDIEFRCDGPTTSLMETLQNIWDNYLSYRVSHPGWTDWSPASRSPDAALLRAIIHFVTANGEDEMERLVRVEGYQFPRWAKDPYARERFRGRDDGDQAPRWTGAHDVDQYRTSRPGDEDEDEDDESDDSPPERWDESSSSDSSPDDI